MGPNGIDSALTSNWQGSDNQRNVNNNDLDREAFLRLLVTQLQHQDPLNPMENHEFIAQLAQFSSLEQMQNLNNNSVRSQAFQLVGREIVAEVRNEATGTSEAVVGRATSAVIHNGNPYLIVESPLFSEPRKISMNDVVYTGMDGDMTEAILANINRNLLSSQNMALVGQHAQFVERDEDGNITSFLEGRIDSIRFDPERGLLLVVGNREVTASSILEFSGSPLLIGREVMDASNRRGTIRNITVNADNSFQLLLDPASGEEPNSINVDSIVDLNAAMRYVGTEFSNGTQSGRVTGIRILSGVINLVLDNGEDSVIFEFRNNPNGAPNQSS